MNFRRIFRWIIPLACALSFLVSLHLLNYALLSEQADQPASDPSDPLPASKVLPTLPPKCQSFVDASKNPGVHFLGPKGPIKDISAIPNNIPRRITFVHFNEHFRNPRYLCAIESAARQNPNHQIYVYTKNVSDFVNATQGWLERADSVKGQLNIIQLVWEEMFKETPLQQWWDNETYKESKWVQQNLGNAFRLGALWKHGGVYLDMDIISLNPVGGMGRSLAMQTGPNIVNNAFFSFEKKDKFVWEMMDEFVEGFNGTVWGRNGPRMVDRYGRALLNSRQFKALSQDIKKALQTQIDRKFTETFGGRMHLIGVTEPWKKMCGMMQKLSKNSVGVHWWNKGLKGQTIKTKTVLQALMTYHCPAVVEEFGEKDLGYFNPKNIKKGRPNWWVGFEVDDGFK